MIHDKSPKYVLGFGIDPSKLPVKSDPDGNMREGPNPQSSFISKALNNHPILRFLAVSTATMVGTHVASKMVEQGGLKLGKQLVTQLERPSGMAKEWRTTLLHDFRNLQGTLNEWQGISGVAKNLGEEVKEPINHHGFWQTYVERERARDLAEKGNIITDVKTWMLRDSLQKKLVQQARRLPYTLPAAYITQRAVVDKLSGTNDTNRPKWNHPFDVIGDFAEQSVKNVVGMMAPWELGQAALSHGVQNLMTYGDFAAETMNTAAGRGLGRYVKKSKIQDFSLGLNSSLNQIGQDAGDLLYKMIQKTHQGTSAFATALGEGVNRDRSTGEKITAARKGFLTNRKKFIRDTGPEGFLATALPKASGFVGGFQTQWRAEGHKIANREAINAGRKTFKFNGPLTEELSGRIFKHGKPTNEFTTNINLHGESESYIEKLAMELNALTGKGTKEGVLRGQFGKDRLKLAYKDELARQLKGLGVDPAVAKRFTEDTAIIHLPGSNKGQITNPGVHKRLSFGEGMNVFDASEDRYVDQLRRRLEGKMGAADSIKVTQALPAALHRADDIFTGRQVQKNIRDQIYNEWQQHYQKIIVPSVRDNMSLGKLPYERFTKNMTAGDRELLVRKSAEQLGVPLFDQSGAPRHLADIKSAVKGHGLDADDHYKLKAFLMDRGSISKPWTMQGYNILGLRRLSVTHAMEKNYFSENNNKRIESLMGDVGKLDPYIGKDLERGVGGWVWEDRYGKTIDLTDLRHSGRKLVNAFSDNVQIPLLHIKPLETAFYNLSRKRAERPIIQHMVRGGATRFMGQEAEGIDSFLWIKGKGSSGNVFGFKRTIRTLEDEETHKSFSVSKLSKEVTNLGSFKTDETDASSMPGRMARLALGDTGRHMPEEDRKQGWRGKLRSKFNVDYNQPNSIFNLVKRGWTQERRVADIENNPASFAAAMSKGVPGSFDEHAGNGFTKWMEKLRNFGVTPKVARALMVEDESLGATFKAFDPAINQEVELSQVKDADQMIRVVQNHYDQVQSEMTRLANATDDPDAQAKIRQLQGAQAPIRRYLEDSKSRSSLNKSSAQAMRSSGIHTRLDELRADFYRYLSVTDAVTSGQGEEQINKMLNALEKLRQENRIGGGEYVEARTAILSMQTNFFSTMEYNQDSSTLEHQHRVMQRVVHAQEQYKRSHGLKTSALEDMGRYEPDMMHEGFPRKPIKRFMKQHWGRGDYAYPGEEYNPFGEETSAVFVPTFRQAAKGGFGNAVRATGSVIGANTWSDPTHYNSSSIPVAHGLQRMNKMFQYLGLGLDETKFKGPLHMVASGYIGRRILPAFAAGASFMAVDRTLGGMVTPRDAGGHRVYRPLITGTLARGVVSARVGSTRLLHGQDAADKKKEELLHGETAVRKGRWWPIGNTPWKGGRVQYYRPSWYRRLESGGLYTDQTYGSPLEHLGFGYDFSPLRPLDPYRFERKHYQDRPYPVSGEYFTGPWGPLTGALNMTVGRILKPPVKMHTAEVQQAMSQYQRVGQYGMAPEQFGPAERPVLAPTGGGGVSVMAQHTAGEVLGARRGGYHGVGTSIGGSGYAGRPSGMATITPINPSIGTYSPAGAAARGSLAVTNTSYEMAASRGPARSRIPYEQKVLLPSEGFSPRLIPAASPLSAGGLKYQSSQLAYESQQMFGIYGFAFGAARQALGFGKQDYAPDRPVLMNASRAYGSERSFWDMNLGGAGDVPNPSEGDYGNLEFGEVMRRFMPHRRGDVNELNPIPNELGRQYPWLPGNDYFQNFKTGDPYSQISEGEYRLPGAAYERTHQLHPDSSGQYGLVDQFSILGNTAPWSNQYKVMNKMLSNMHLAPDQKQSVQQTREQVAEINKRTEFTPYVYSHSKLQTTQAKVLGFDPGEADVLNTTMGKIRFAGVSVRKTQESMEAAQRLVRRGQTVDVTYDANQPPPEGSPLKAIINAGGTNVNKALLSSNAGYIRDNDTAIDQMVIQPPAHRLLGRLRENLAHKDTPINTKFFPERTAVEDWERSNVYGTDFPQWQHPYRDFIKPLSYRAANRNPFISAAVLAGVGSAFGTNPRAKTAFKIVGAAAGFALGAVTNADQLDKGTRFIPLNREKEMAAEEYSDILNYVKYTSLYSSARQEAIRREGVDPERVAKQTTRNDNFTNLGPATAAALEYRRDARQTMYGADLHGDIMDESAAMPSRKRDHFMAFMQAPLDERKQILSTAPRLERRMYEARWGMKIEKRPDLEQYFKEHELPGPEWEGWSPEVPSDAIRVKIAQSQGLDVSQMGYYQQQQQEANLINVSYPDFHQGSNHKRVADQLRKMMFNQGVNGRVTAVPSSIPGARVHMNVQAG